MGSRGPERGLSIILSVLLYTLLALVTRQVSAQRALEASSVAGSEGAKRPWQQQRRSQLRWNYANVSLDDARQREALLALYNATTGPAWKVTNASSSGATAWGTAGISYCRWYGITCCATSPLSLVDCEGLHSVAILSLDGFGLVGSLPAALGDLPELTVLALANNPQLTGALPPSLAALSHLLWLSVEGTGVVACTEAAGGGGGGSALAPSIGGPCTLPSSLSFASQPYNPYGTDSLLCPAALLTSFLSYTSDVPPDLWDMLTSPFPAPPTPGAVIADGNFTRFYQCSCSRPGESLVVGEAGAACVSASKGGGGRLGLIVAVVVVATVPWLLVSAVVYICVVHKATLNRVVRRKEAEMARKRSKVPGTPGVVLQNGRGMLSLSDVMVTWVVTDVAASTQLWEWKPDVMDRAIDMHNVALRSLMETYGGHEIRNEGDSFTLSFHDAVDAVMFCIKAQEKLMTVDWPKELAEHPRTNTKFVGDVTSHPEVAGKGPPLIAGLRVRMGINTGLPNDIFMHDMTDHVDYRGMDYDLAGEICDLAEGGQVLMGPRTLQRWNKVNYSALIDPLTADLMRDQNGSFLGGTGQNPLAHGTSGRRGSVTGFGGNVNGGVLSLTRDSQQLALMYGSNVGAMPSAAPSSGAPPLGLSLAPSMRRNSDTHTLPQAGSGPPFARLTDGEGSDEEAGSSTRPSAAAAGSAAAPRAPRVHHTSSPSRLLQRVMPIRDGYSSDGTVAAGGGGSRGGQTGSPLMSMHRSKLGSPRSVHLGSVSYNDNALRPRAAIGATAGSAAPSSGLGAGSRGDEAAGSRSGPVQLSNSAASAQPRSAVEGLLRQHAARAAENAAAAAAAAAAARAERERGERVSARSGLAARALALLTGGGANLEASDEDRGSPRRSSPVPVPVPRLAAARGSTGSIADAPAAGSAGAGSVGAGPAAAVRRRGDEADYTGVSAPVGHAPGLQRWLSHGWRGRAGPVLPRAHTLAGTAASAAAAAAAAVVGTGAATAPPSALPQLLGSSGAGHSPGSGSMALFGPGRNTGSGGSLGGRVLWSRLNGGGAAAYPGGGMPANVRALGFGHARGGIVNSNGGSLEGPASVPLVPFEDEAAVGSGSSNRGLSRVTSLPAAAAGAMAAGLSRLAALHRRGGPSREGSLRMHNPLFLRQNSRDGSRDGRGTDTSGAATPMRSESHGPHQVSQHTLQSGGAGIGSGAAGSPGGSPSGTHDQRSDGGGVPPGSGGGGGSGGGAGIIVLGQHGSGSGAPGGGGGGGRLEMLRTSASRRTLGTLPGPPRMLRTSDTGLHPLLLNPMQPGGGAAMHPLLSRVPPLRHSQPPMGRPAGPSPLGLGGPSTTGDGANTGPHSMAGHEPLQAGAETWGDSLTSGAPTRHLTPASTFRHPLQDATFASMDGLAGSSAVHGGDSAGSKPASNGLQPTASGGHGGSHPQLSYLPNGTQGGYYPADCADAFGSVVAAGPGPGPPPNDQPLVLRLVFAARILWFQLVYAFRRLLRRCLMCVRLLTSSDDDPAGVELWDHTDGSLVGRGDGVGPMGHRSLAVGSKPQETKGVLVDMGYYRFSAIDAAETRPMDQFVHLMQVVPASVASRVLLFPWPLSLPDGWEKISPGFFDAPGSARLLFPAMRELLGADVQSLRPVVTVAFSSVEGFKELSALNVETARQVLAMHNMAVRETLSACAGYECKEFNGNFMATFATPTDAVEWALTLQLALLAMRWPPALLACDHTALVLHPDTNAVLFNGLRCRVGIYAGPIDRVTPHPKTGRADYFGQPVNRAARLMTAALGGQVVLDQNLLEEVLEEWRRRQEVRRLATIPSADEHSIIEEGSLIAPSEIRAARSFVSVRSATRIAKQQSAITGTFSAAASSTPSITNLPQLPEFAHQQHSSPRADGAPHAAANVPAAMAPPHGTSAVGVGPDGMPPSPFGSPGGNLLSRLLPGHGLREITTDGSASPRGSVHRGGMSPVFNPSTVAGAAGTGGTVFATAGAAGLVSITAASNAAPSGGQSVHAADSTAGGSVATSGLTNTNSGNSLARNLERLLLDRTVQRSARSEPRIPRISRFGLGLGGLAAALRGGGGGGTPPAAAVPASATSGSPHAGGGVTGLVDTVAGSGGLMQLPPHVVQAASLPPPLNAVGSVPLPWQMDAAGAGPSSYAHGAGYVRRSPNGGSRLVPSPRGVSYAHPAAAAGFAAAHPPSSASAAAAAAAAAAPWLHPPSLTRPSPSGSMHSSVAGAASAGGAETNLYGAMSLAPGLELQPAEWDPAARGAANRARRRRRASIGAIVENLLVAGRKASMTAAMTGSVHGGRGGIFTAASVGPGRSPPSRASPAAALSRMLPGSPLGGTAAGGGGSASGAGSGSGAGSAALAGGSVRASTATAFASAAGLHVDLPESPSNSSNPLTSPRSPGTIVGLLVRRMASSPLGPAPHGGAALSMTSSHPPSAAGGAAADGGGGGSQSGCGGTGTSTNSMRAAGSTHSGGGNAGGGASNSGGGISGSGHISRSTSRGSGLGRRSGGGAPWSAGHSQPSALHSPGGRSSSLQLHPLTRQQHHHASYHHQPSRHSAAYYNQYGHTGAGLPPPPPPSPPHERTLSPSRGRLSYHSALPPSRAMHSHYGLQPPSWAAAQQQPHHHQHLLHGGAHTTGTLDEGRASGASNATQSAHPQLTSVAEGGSPSSSSQNEGGIPSSAAGGVAAPPSVAAAPPPPQALMASRRRGLSTGSATAASGPDGEASGPLLETAISAVAPARLAHSSGSSLLISRGSVVGAPGPGGLVTCTSGAVGAEASRADSLSPEMLLGCRAVLEGATSGSVSDRESSSSSAADRRSREAPRRRPRGRGSVGAGVTTFAAAPVSEATTASTDASARLVAPVVGVGNGRMPPALIIHGRESSGGGAEVSPASLPSDPARRPLEDHIPLRNRRAAVASRWHRSRSRSRSCSSAGSPAPGSRGTRAEARGSPTASGGVAPVMSATESEASVLPSFGVNLLPMGRSGGASRTGRASGSFSSARSDAVETLALPHGAGGRASLAPTPMIGRGLMTLHGNPIFSAPRGGSGTVGGEAPITEEEDGWAEQAEEEAEQEPKPGSLELIATTASSRRLMAAATAASAAGAAGATEAPTSQGREPTAPPLAPPPQAQQKQLLGSMGTQVDNPMFEAVPSLEAEGSNADMLLALPPMTTQTGNHTAASTAADAVKPGKNSDGPDNTPSLTVTEAAPRDQHAGDGRRGSGGTMDLSGLRGDGSSPQRHGSTVNLSMDSSAHGSAPALAGAGGRASTRRSAHGLRTVASALPYGGVPALPQPVDPALLAAVAASSGSGNVNAHPGRAGRPLLSGSTSGNAPCIGYDPAAMASSAGAARPAAQPGHSGGASSSRRRASYGGIAVSLRAAAEAAISQLQAMNANNIASNSTSYGRRVLRKSTSSRSRRHYTGASSGSADTASGLAAAAGAFSSAAGTAAAIATPRPHRTSSMRRAGGGHDVSGGGGLPLAEHFYHAGVRLDSRLSSPPLDRMLGAPRVTAPNINSSSSAGHSHGLAGQGAVHLRRSAPGFPQGNAVGAPAVGGGSGGTSAAPLTQTAFEPPRASHTRRSSGASPAGTPPVHTSRLTAVAYPPPTDMVGVPPLYAIHGPGPAPINVHASSRRSSATSQAAGPGSQASPGHASPSLTTLLHPNALQQQHHSAYAYHSSGSSAYGRQGAHELMTSPQAGAVLSGPATSAPGLFPRGQRPAHGIAAAAAAAGLAPAPVSASGHGIRGALRSSTPQLSLPAAVASAVGSATQVDAAAVAAAVAAVGSAAGSGPLRLRASNQSLPDEAQLAAQAAAAPLPGPPPSTRGGGARWRSPRTPPHPDDGTGAAPAGGGGGALDRFSVPIDIGGGGGTAGAAAGGRTQSGVPRGMDKEKEKESRPAVMAECYKITQQPADAMGGGANAVAQSITMIKYTNLKQELERQEEGEGDDVPVPTNMMLVPTVAVEVAIWSLGSFRLKGVTEPIKIVQVLPASLEGRLSLLNKAGLNRGKARCIDRKVTCLDVLTLQLPDVSRLTCVMAANGASADGVSEDGGAGGGMQYGALAAEAAEAHGAGDGTGGAAATRSPWMVPSGEQHGSAAAAAAMAAEAQAMGCGGVVPFAGSGGGGPGPSGGSGGGAPMRLLNAGAIVLGQATSPAEMAARGMGSLGGMGGIRGMAIRELESSEVGLPPISEVITPASSPTLRSRDRLPGSRPLSLQGTASGALEPSEPGSAGLSRRRGVAPPRPLAIPEAPSALEPDAPSGDVAPDAAAANAAVPSPVRWRMSEGTVTVSSPARPAGVAARPAPSPPVLMRVSDGNGSLLSASLNARHHLPPRHTGAYRSQVSVESVSGAEGGDRPSARSTQLASALGSGGGGTDSSVGAVGGGAIGAASTARLSTGLLPSSLSYLAMRSSRDAPAATLAAMLSAGMDMRSPGGSPRETLNSYSRSAGVPGASLGSGDTSDGISAAAAAYGDVPLPDLAAAVAAAAAAVVTAAPPPAVATAALLAERSSAGTPTHAQLPLVIDRSSSGFQLPWSGRNTPGAAMTERSSSSYQHAPHLTPSDRTSSGLQRSGLYTPPAMTDRSSRSSAPAANVASPLPPLPPPAPAAPPPTGAGTSGSEAGGDEGSGASGPGTGTWGPGPSRFVREQQHQQEQFQQLLRGDVDPYADYAYESNSSDGGLGRAGHSTRYGPEATEAQLPPPSLQGPALSSSLQLQASLPPTLQLPAGAGSLEEGGIRPLSPRQFGVAGDMRAVAVALNDARAVAPAVRIHNASGLPAQAAAWTSGGAAAAAIGRESSGGGSMATSPDSAAAVTTDVTRVPTFSSLVPTGSNVSAVAGGLDFGGYDVTISMRSSMAGSAVAPGGGGGRVSAAGMAAVDSLRGFGLGHLAAAGLPEPASASDLLRPFAQERNGSVGVGAVPSRQGSNAQGMGVGSGRQRRWTRMGSGGSGSGPGSGAGGL